MEKNINISDIIIDPKSIENMDPSTFKVVVISKEGLTPVVLFIKANGMAKYAEEACPLLTPGLKKIKKIIIPSNNRYFIYSYETDTIVSTYYDKILYDEESKTFHVEYHYLTNYGAINLFGVLDANGYLIGGMLYSPEIDGAYAVDETNLEASIAEQKDKIEIDIKRRMKANETKEYCKFEYDNFYLGRGKK